MLSCLLHTAVVWLVIFAMMRATAATGILLQYTGPAFCALFAWVFQRRRIAPMTGVAILIAAVGIGIMFLGSHGDGWTAPLCGLLSGVAYGGLILVLEKLGRPSDGRPPASPFLIVMYNNLGTAVLLLPLAMAGGSLQVDWRQFALVSATGVLLLALPYLLFQLALRRVEPVDASLLILLEPILNPIWVAMAIGERPDLTTWIGGAAILLAMAMEAVKLRRAALGHPRARHLHELSSG